MSLLKQVVTTAPTLPSRFVLYAPEKAGKTSFGCFAPKPIFMMTAGETGLLSLIESGQVPETAHFPHDFRQWPHLQDALEELINENHDYRTLILDTGNGAENLLIQYVVDDTYGGKKSRFLEYGKGYEVCTNLWADFLRRLDDLRVRRGMAVLFLHHARAKSFKDPAGVDYDQWRPEANDKLWSLTHKWADGIVYYGSRVQIDRNTEKATGRGERFLQCGGTPAILAGNRYGMPDVINAPANGGPQALWNAFAVALRAAKAKAKAAQQPPPPPPGGGTAPADPAPVPPAPPAASAPPAAPPPPPVQTPAPVPPAPAADATPTPVVPVQQYRQPPADDAERAALLGRVSAAAGALGVTADQMFADVADQVGTWPIHQPLPPVTALSTRQLKSLAILAESRVRDAVDEAEQSANGKVPVTQPDAAAQTARIKGDRCSDLIKKMHDASLLWDAACEMWADRLGLPEGKVRIGDLTVAQADVLEMLVVEFKNAKGKGRQRKAAGAAA